MFTIIGADKKVREVLGKFWPVDMKSNTVSEGTRTAVFAVSDAAKAARIRALLQAETAITFSESN